MLVEKNSKKYNNITYGNVAYELKPEIEKEERKKHKAKPIKKNKNSLKLKLISFVGVTFLCGLLILYRFAVIISLSGDVRSIKTKISTMQNENQNLIVELSKSSNIRYVDKMASEKYGMVVPNRKNTMFIDVKELNKKTNVDEFQQDKGTNKLFGLIR